MTTTDELLQRCSTLIDVLSAGELLDGKGIILLCQQWAIMPVVTFPANGGKPYYDIAETIHELAKHAIEKNEDEHG